VSDTDVQLAQQAYAAFNRGDVDGALQHLDPNIQWRMSDQFTRTTRVFHGHAGVREVFAMFTDVLDEFRAEVKTMHDAGTAVIAEVQIGGVLRGTTDPVSYDLVQVWTIRDRQAVSLDVYATLEEAWSAVSTTPPDSSSAAISDSETGRLNRNP